MGREEGAKMLVLENLDDRCHEGGRDAPGGRVVLAVIWSGGRGVLGCGIDVVGVW